MNCVALKSSHEPSGFVWRRGHFAGTRDELQRIGGMGATTFQKVALASVDWARWSLREVDSRKCLVLLAMLPLALHRNGIHGFIGTSVGAVAGWVALFVDAAE